jgi:futalosine hydrolase
VTQRIGHQGEQVKPVLVTAATPGELAAVISALGARERFQLGPRDAFRGLINGRPVVAMATGMGKVNSAAAVSALLSCYEPELVINTGCAGSYPGSGLGVGDLALASLEVCGDEGVETVDGWRSLELIGIPVVEKRDGRYFNGYPVAGWAMDKALHVAGSTGTSLRSGVFVTVSTVSGTTARGAEISARFGGICENMEGAAAAQVALIHGADFMEIRGISNLVEDRDLSRWDIPRAVARAQQFTISFIESLII